MFRRSRPIPRRIWRAQSPWLPFRSQTLASTESAAFGRRCLARGLRRSHTKYASSSDDSVGSAIRPSPASCTETAFIGDSKIDCTCRLATERVAAPAGGFDLYQGFRLGIDAIAGIAAYRSMPRSTPMPDSMSSLSLRTCSCRLSTAGSRRCETQQIGALQEHDLRGAKYHAALSRGPR